MRLLSAIFTIILLITLLSSCKKDNPQPVFSDEDIKVADLVFQLKLIDEYANATSYLNPLKVIILDEKKDTAFMGYFDTSTLIQKYSDEAQLKLKLPVGIYETQIIDSTERFAPAKKVHGVYGKEIRYLNTEKFQLSKFPNHEIDVLSITDTIKFINSQFPRYERGWLIDINSSVKGNWSSKNVPYFYLSFSKSSNSYPFKYNFGWDYREPILEGKRKFFLPEYWVNNLKLDKGDSFYISIVEAVAGTMVASLTEYSRDSTFYNATGKTVQNFKIVY